MKVATMVALVALLTIVALVALVATKFHVEGWKMAGKINENANSS